MLQTPFLKRTVSRKYYLLSFIELHNKYAITYLSYCNIIYKKNLLSSFTESKMILKENVSEYQPKLIKKIMLTLCWILALCVSGAEVREIYLPGKSLLWWGLVFVVLSDSWGKWICIFPCLHEFFLYLFMLASGKELFLAFLQAFYVLVIQFTLNMIQNSVC